MEKVVKSIKNVDKKVWLELKTGSSKRGITMAEFLKKLVEEHKQLESKKRIPKSMFGAHPEMTPFTREDEADFHEL